MAKTFRDLSKRQVFLLAGGCAAYLTAIVAAGLLSIGMTAKDDAAARKEKAQRIEPKPPVMLQQVPEVVIAAIPANPQNARGQINQLVQTIRNEDQINEEGFVKKLIKERPDLQGLPFLMGGACRMNAATASIFGSAVGITHDSIQAEDTAVFPKVDALDRFSQQWSGQDNAAGVAALTQIYGPEKQSRREGLARHLRKINHPSATIALARAAVFDFDGEVRLAATDGLKNRSKKDYTDVLLTALRHPWPTAAHNAARVITRLDRQDLVPQLVAFLAERNPNEPFAKDVNGESKMVVREMVKVNHHRNCLLCHPPAPAGQQAGGVFGVVPTPGESFAPPEGGGAYGGSPGDAMIRADVTYLRQDFSILASVPNAQPWPEKQRFDFLVRTRVLTDDEVRNNLKERQARVPGQLSENQMAAAEALHRLTGKSAAPNAVAWAQVLDMPVPQAAKQ
jgi:hypothetical protein